MPEIGILGCGWLGLPLAKNLIEKGYFVKGTTTSLFKEGLLLNERIKPYIIQVSENGISGNLEEFLNNTDIVIINIPPKANENYSEIIRQIALKAEKAKVKKIIFASSISVYNDSEVVVTEDTKPNPNNKNGIELLKAENILRKNIEFETTILRFGGLIGQDRHPVKYLAGRDNLEHPDAPINLIHLDDCIAIIARIIEQNLRNVTLNAVAPYHPSRETYYSQKAKKMKLPIPLFIKGSSKGKIVDSQKLTSLLNYKFTGDI